jgi:hypothetical protein
MRAHYDTVLAPALEAAKHDCVKSKALIVEVLSWTKQVLVMGLLDSFAQEVQNAIPSMIESLVRCYNEAFDKCVSNRDPAQVVNLLSALRQLAMFGAEGQVDQSKMERCVSFRLEYDSVTEEIRPGEVFSWNHHVHASVPLTVSLATGPIATGSAALVYASPSYTGLSLETCRENSVATGSIFQVVKTSVDFNVFQGNSPPPQPLTLEYDPGYPSFVFTVSCPLVPPQIFKLVRWRSDFLYDLAHSGERFGAGFLARDWERPGGDIYARKRYHLTVPYGVETTVMTLKHTPQ